MIAYSSNVLKSSYRYTDALIETSIVYFAFTGSSAISTAILLSHTIDLYANGDDYFFV